MGVPTRIRSKRLFWWRYLPGMGVPIGADRDPHETLF
jgi:hypothetical protein